MISFPTTNTTTSLIYSANPSGMATLHTVTTAEDVKGWIGDNLYDNTLSVANNILRAVANDNFPTAYPITLKGMEFDADSFFLLSFFKIIFPKNVTLDNCQVKSGVVTFYQGAADAIARHATVIACGPDATANATAEGTEAKAVASGATANARAAGASAIAESFGTTANATVSGAWACAFAFGATANATAHGTTARASASGATANATAGGSDAYAVVSGATANATVSGASASARKHGAIASATAYGAKSYADVSGATANATVAGAHAWAWDPDSVAIARHALASADSEAVFGGKAISYSEFMIISENLDRVFDLSLNDSNRANAAYAVGMAFCNGKGVKQSDTLATIFLSGAHELEHRYAAFELGQLYSKKRIWFRRDQPLADHWYSKETSDAKRVRELAPKYALLFESLRENKSALQGVPEDVIKTIGNFLSRL